MPLGPERWLVDLPRRPEDPPGVARVSQLLPAGYASYLRLFHPFRAWDAPSTDPVRRSWRELAAEARVSYHAELDWDSLLPALDAPDGERRFEVAEGEIASPTRAALFRQLEQHTVAPVHVYFGLGAMVAGGEPLLYRAPADAIEAARDRAAHVGGRVVPGPELVWPEDRSWVLRTDYDLASSYIACDPALASSIAADPALEVVPVTRGMRVDDRSDTLNRPDDRTR